MGPFEVTSETGVDWVVSNHALWDSLEDSIASFIGYYKVAHRKLGPILSPKKSNIVQHDKTLSRPVSLKTSRTLMAHAYVQ